MPRQNVDRKRTSRSNGTTLYDTTFLKRSRVADFFLYRSKIWWRHERRNHDSLCGNAQEWMKHIHAKQRDTFIHVLCRPIKQLLRKRVTDTISFKKHLPFAHVYALNCVTAAGPAGGVKKTNERWLPAAASQLRVACQPIGISSASVLAGLRTCAA